MDGQKTKILLDIGCSRTMVSHRLIPPENYFEGKGVSVRCAHGDINFYPLAKVEIGVRDLKLIMEAAVAENPTVPVLLGTDVPQLFQFLGRHPEETCPPRRPDRDDEGEGAAATRERNSQKGEGAGSGSVTALGSGEHQWFS